MMVKMMSFVCIWIVLPSIAIRVRNYIHWCNLLNGRQVSGMQVCLREKMTCVVKDIRETPLAVDIGGRAEILVIM